MPPETHQDAEGRPETTGLPHFSPPRPAAPPAEGVPSLAQFSDELRRALSFVADPRQCARTLDRLVALEIPALFLLLAHDYAERRAEAIWPLTILEALLLLVLLLNRRGLGTVASHIFCVGNWALATWFLFAGDQVSSHAALLAMPAVLLATGLLLNLRLLLGVGVLVLATVIGMAVADSSQWNWTRTGPPESRAETMDALIVIGFSLVSVGLFTRDICEALGRAREQEAKLEVSTTELRRQTETLKGTAQKLQTAMELAVEGVVHADPTGRITNANTRAGEITGYPRDELLGRSFMEFFGADELAACPPQWDELEQGKAVTAERQLIRKDGNRILVEMTSQRLPDRTLQCFVRDITKRRAEEDASRQRQRLEALGTLAGGVAHDFNNLLTVMHAAADALAVRAGTAGAAPLQDLRTAIEQANALTRQLLAFARKQALDRRQVDLRQVIEQNARMLRRLLGPQFELEVVLDEQPCPVFADTGALAQVFTNLAVNARDAMPKGGRLEFGCRVVDGARPPRNNTTALQAGRFVRVHVTDTGTGMSEDVKRRLFEPFFTTKGKEQGTGLGLSVSLGIIEQHGGWIEVTSEVGRGSEFRVFLPRQELLVAAAPATVAPTVAPSVRGTETILLVEDEEPVRRLAAGALALCGFKVIEATTGAEALRLWPALEADVQMLLTDVAMPGGVNGVELAQAVRARRPTLPIMITSGHNQEEVSFGDGCWDDIRFLPKPFTMAALTRMARETLDSPITARKR
ncbi:MAG TPA: ATP-binding protein [Opitutaceae bacterium]|nr:ATP-binding protein [Opitutaceae bacterium]